MKRIFFVLGSILLFSQIVSADTSCPYGLENDPAPGDCVLYVDQDNSAFCDYSEDGETGLIEAEYEEGIHDCDDVAEGELPGSALKAMTVLQVANYYNISIDDFLDEINQEIGIDADPNLILAYYHDNHGLRMEIVKDIVQSLQNIDEDSDLFQNFFIQIGGMDRGILGVIIILLLFFFVLQKHISKKIYTLVLNMLTYILLPLGALIRVVYIASFQQVGNEVFEIGRVLGYACVWLFFFIMIIKPLSVLLKKSSKGIGKYIQNFTAFVVLSRKQLGIAVFWLAFTHFLIYILFWFTKDSALFTFFEARPFWIGLIGLVGLLIGFLTSNTYAMKKFQKHWKTIQMVAYPALVFGIIHVFLINPWRGGVLLFLLIIYGILKWFEWKQTSFLR